MPWPCTHGSKHAEAVPKKFIASDAHTKWASYHQKSKFYSGIWWLSSQASKWNPFWVLT
jgi:hypothetical protein